MKELTASVKHWQRMIDWVKRERIGSDVVTFDCPSDSPYLADMRAAIGETWFGRDCPLCARFHYECEENPCSGCPLAEAGQQCSGFGRNPKSLWISVCHADTWSDWLKAARKLLRLLKELDEQYKRKEAKDAQKKGKARGKA